MSSVNKVILVGNLGRDPQFRDLPNSKQLCILSLATTNSWTDRSGNRRQKTEWHRIAIFDKSLTDSTCQELVRGSKIYVEGMLYTSKYTDRKGIDRFSTQVHVNRFRGTVLSLKNRTDTQSFEDIETEDSYEELNDYDIDDFVRDSGVSESELYLMSEWGVEEYLDSIGRNQEDYESYETKLLPTFYDDNKDDLEGDYYLDAFYFDGDDFEPEVSD